MSNIKQLAGQTAVYGLSNIVARFLNYLLVPIYTRVLLTGEYGTVSEFYGYASFLSVIFTYGMETAFFRYAQHSEEKEKVFSTAWWSLIISSLSLALLLMLFTYPLAAVTKNQQHPEYIVYFLFIIAADAITTIPFAWLRLQNKAVRFATLKSVGIGINILLNIFFLNGLPWLDKMGVGWAVSLHGAASGVTYIFLANIASSVLLLPFFIREITFLKEGFDKKLWMQMLRYGWPLLVLGLAGMVNETLDRVIMKYIIKDPVYAMQQTGIYGANYKLSMLMTLFIQAFRFAAEPFFFSRAKEENAPKIYAKVMQYFIMICCVIFLLVTLYIDVFKIFIGSAFHEGLKVVPVLLLANLFLGVYYNLSVWYKLTDKTSYGASITIAGAVITIVMNLLLIPSLSYMGSAWATLACYFSITVMSYVLGQKYYPIPYEVGNAVKCIGLALVFYFIYTFMREMHTYGKIGYATLQLIGTLEFLAYGVWMLVMERKIRHT